MPARSGGQYLAGLRDGRDIWYGGKRVADVTTHPAFAPGAQAIAQLYDMQQHPTTRELTLRHASAFNGSVWHGMWSATVWPRVSNSMNVSSWAIRCI